MLNPLKTKYHPFYMNIAKLAAEQSVAKRHQVGAVVVTPSGMISTGWNGMPAGFVNDCEYGSIYDSETMTYRKVSKPEVIHAERNAIDKMTRQGVSTDGAILFTTRSPCFECAKAIHGLGLRAVIYDELHDCTKGLDMLIDLGILVHSI